MKHSKRDQLLKEILTGDDLSDFRQASLERGLAVIRRQRQRRHVVHACVLASLPFLLVAGILIRRAIETPPGRMASANPAANALPAPRAGSREVKFITDEELFALFPNRSLALIGKPGNQQLVFLDQRIAPAENR